MQSTALRLAHNFAMHASQSTAATCPLLSIKPPLSMKKSAFRRWFTRLSLTLIALLVLAAVFAAQTLYFRPASLNLLYLRSVLLRAVEMPEILSRLHLLDSYGLAFYRDDLNDYSTAQDEADIRLAKRDLADFESFDISQLRGNDKISAQIFAYNKKLEVDGERWRFHDFPVNQMFGVQSGLPNFMVNIHEVKSVAEGRDYVARLNLFQDRLGQVLAGLKEREAKGVVPPRFTIEKVLQQMQSFTAKTPKENLLYVSLEEKLNKIPVEKLSAGQRTELLQQTEQAIANSVLPGFRGLISYFEALLPKVTSNDGVWRLPDGAAYYAYMVRQHTTTAMTPDEIHQVGIEEVARLRQEIEAILSHEGALGASLKERVHNVSTRPEQLYSNDEAGKKQMLADYQSIINEIDAGLTPMFNLRPSSSVVVRPVPKFAEKTAPGAYYEFPSLDGKRPGTFFANMRDLSDNPKFGMRTLAYHEAIPGHHFQIALQMKMTDLPLFRRMGMFTAYSEGWALYAERLAWEAGFQKKPLDNLGRLQAEMFRAVRLVVDTGMHHKRWNREKAISYMMENTGNAETEATAEVERYLVSPGQALAYKTGMLKILQLREQAKKEQGAAFDLRQFHDVVLKNGAMPLGVLENVVQEWTASKLGKSISK